MKSHRGSPCPQDEVEAQNSVTNALPPQQQPLQTEPLAPSSETHCFAFAIAGVLLVTPPGHLLRAGSSPFLGRESLMVAPLRGALLRPGRGAPSPGRNSGDCLYVHGLRLPWLSSLLDVQAILGFTAEAQRATAG